VIKCGYVVLYAEKSWSSLVLVPAPGESSSDSGSESRVYSSSVSGTGIELPWGKDLNAECVLKYSVLCLDCTEKPVMLVMQKCQSSKWLRGSRHTIWTANCIDCLLFNQLISVLKHEKRQISGARTLSWSPTWQPKYSSQAYLTICDSGFLCAIRKHELLPFPHSNHYTIKLGHSTCLLGALPNNTAWIKYQPDTRFFKSSLFLQEKLY
jgi:hypothetical protein